MFLYWATVRPIPIADMTQRGSAIAILTNTVTERSTVFMGPLSPMLHRTRVANVFVYFHLSIYSANIYSALMSNSPSTSTFWP